MSEESFEFFNTYWFFDDISVVYEEGYGDDDIIRCLANERSDFCHDLVIEKREMGSLLGTIHTLIHGVSMRRVNVLRGDWSTR